MPPTIQPAGRFGCVRPFQAVSVWDGGASRSPGASAGSGFCSGACSGLSKVTPNLRATGPGSYNLAYVMVTDVVKRSALPGGNGPADSLMFSYS